PDDPGMQLALARVMLLQNQPADAIQIVEKVPPATAPAWQLALLRGRALIELNRWDEAKTVLPGALKLNPEPAEAHYLMGLVYQHGSDWQRAAESFRRAFESTPAGRQAAVK